MLLNLLLLAASVAHAFDCSSQAIQEFLPSNVSIKSAVWVPENGIFNVPPSNVAYPESPTGLRALCAIEVHATSSSNSSFNFGLFLPNGWNQRFLAVGNGGFAGGINWLDMGAGVGYGFATMSTNTGHNSTAPDVTWSLNAPESKIDWGYRAMHESVVLSKKIIAAYYGSASTYNYYSGCSTGGRQGLRDIQLYPDDFDGVLAGAPAWWTSHLQTWTLKVALYNLPRTAEHHIPESLFPIIEAEVLKQCDPQDGVKDNIISDPEGCDFYPEALLCSNTTNSSSCLTIPQLDTLSHIQSDYVETNQTFVFPRLSLGSESQWSVLLGDKSPSTYGSQYIQYFVLNDPSWNIYDFNYSIVELADAIQPGNASATAFGALNAFKSKGGKVLHYHGLADGYIPTGSSEVFYKQVLRATGKEDLGEWYRYFEVPGMQHCSGTQAGVDAPWYFAGGSQAGSLSTSLHSVLGFSDPDHDALLALMRWTESGTAPERLVATKWKNDTLQDSVLRQRPVCPYPRQAKYDGWGDVNKAECWKCELPWGGSTTQ
ncbi:uncharacterized protein MYCFIDRAFT_55662 [Pseudocercospora fijiensis CIRAD86]|uniref:Carboxylic ester hydrolase n=1 Tax=Pseudocercospora fijiensis (strain CIRAD86) TaxID=383855 RepID=N1QCF0_PSEFD|nr:uncharacterized protein MYCFIDRAFT_55662 [Pseudocercospora fijiensis CIRAD86]EME89222.1 hypothetical protein MYCFIDRAFT_55662 [Pseudocercospora fijiensis CIRAD86]